MTELFSANRQDQENESLSPLSIAHSSESRWVGLYILKQPTEKPVNVSII